MNSNRSAQPPSGTHPVHLWTAGGVLTGVALLAYPAFAIVGHRGHGWTGVAAASVAAGTCWGGAMMALVLTALFQRHTQAVAGTLAGMFFRLGLPLGIGLWLHAQRGPLAEAGVVGMIVAFYFVTLSAETVLAVRLVRATASSGMR